MPQRPHWTLPSLPVVLRSSKRFDPAKPAPRHNLLLHLFHSLLDSARVLCFLPWSNYQSSILLYLGCHWADFFRLYAHVTAPLPPFASDSLEQARA